MSSKPFVVADDLLDAVGQPLRRGMAVAWQWETAHRGGWRVGVIQNICNVEGRAPDVFAGKCEAPVFVMGSNGLEHLWNHNLVVIGSSVAEVDARVEA